MRALLKYASIWTAVFALAWTAVPVSAVRPGINIQGPTVQDSSGFKALSNKLDDYIKAIEPLEIQEQEEECDFLINTCTDSLVRQFVTLKLYNHYMSSRIMGSEAVAIHIADNWLFTGKVRMHSDIELMTARIYADFNRSSLLGMQAPELTLRKRDDTNVRLTFGDDGNNNGRYSVLFFYDTQCPECLAQAILLRRLLEGKEFPIDFYAIYTGSDEDSWDRFVSRELTIDAPEIRFSNLWDPEMDSDFQRKYGILKTPGIFLIDGKGVITGRRLDATTLVSMLSDIYPDYRYGSEESGSLFDDYFSAIGSGYTVADVDSLAAHIAKRTSNNKTVFKEMIGDLFYYLSTMSDERLKEGNKHIIDKYILSRPDIWDTHSDSLKVIGYAETMSELLSRTPVGSRLPALKVQGRMVSHRIPDDLSSGKKIRTWNLRKIQGGKYIMFYSRNCQDCTDNLAAADSLLRSDKKMKILLVDMTACLGEGEEPISPENEKILDTFDLTKLPFILQVGKDGLVSRRYIQFSHKRIRY